MFDKKQIQNIRNTWFKVQSGKLRSQIGWMASTLSQEVDDGPDRDAVYWATIWHFSLPENRAEFYQMFNEMTADGSMLSLEEGSMDDVAVLKNNEMSDLSSEDLENE